MPMAQMHGMTKIQMQTCGFSLLSCYDTACYACHHYHLYESFHVFCTGLHALHLFKRTETVLLFKNAIIYFYEVEDGLLVYKL